ncbi:MAG TPA: hypothetical protein VNI01_10135 [Elusimicrobiota bacterium]|jgi:hypothetical protein|nr:hypothetical protein [Elusimicrobiota bacterium]
MALRSVDLPESAEALAAAVCAWGREVLERYGWTARGDEFACNGCPATGSLCEIFATARPFHPVGLPGAGVCREQARRRRVYGRELATRPAAVGTAARLPAALVGLVMAYEPTFGLVLGRGYLLGPPPGRAGDHSDCSLCLRQRLWAPGTQAAPRLAFALAQCDARNRGALELARQTWYQDAAQYVAWHPRPCGSCGRLMALAQQKALCPGCSGRGVGLRCQCVEIPWLGCFYCQEFVPFPVLKGLPSRAGPRPAARGGRLFCPRN